MAKSKSSKGAARLAFRCSECGWSTAKWVGQCRECQSWGTVVECGGPAPGQRTQPAVVSNPALPIVEVQCDDAAHRRVGVPEFDRVLGGGIVPGSVILLAGEPGAGKSTLVLDVAARVAGCGGKVLYVTGEESASQVKLRAERIGAIHPGLLLAAETNLGAVLTHVQEHSPDLLIVDSVQTISSADVEGAAGNAAQVREVAGALIGQAKSRNMACVVIGHVTKDGSVAGPRVLEHLVDVVCQFEGDRHARLRMVRAVKNRYGTTDEVGCFELTDHGISGLPDPSGLFLSKNPATAGSCVALTVEGRRPLAVEVQALTTESAGANPRRTTHGVDSARVGMIVAVLQRRLGVPLGSKDIFVSTVGGARLAEPATDLAIALALTSSVTNEALDRRVAAFGEVSLSGEVRPVVALPRRVQEAARLGFSRVLVPHESVQDLDQSAYDLEVVGVADMVAAAQACGGLARV